ncbi:E3 ubiquitin-protein ligase HOS1 [Selaginella moellendorffii]|uniref:E3 ubiquitin-protein ligase HOS1 n=1 Tax=Selaginella moellendorffii TaxID=88036 RepID=UPI000D1C277F|nr:E3 ubiquitin-protein ligase HOS1 [Selaginella moellendorffii]XP_024524648.1 E3 ubiquitin-protein ligase HOS1 [Selaginella moellendorffii]XP_024524649.1 E3 ubiquitin-protein ligase HOS1 [Selaginella moellendorffii]|eukprot:XP_024524647.1 E3 ubiquitin-protein ligase HOS1 [Selaginella moellendorffii]
MEDAPTRYGNGDSSSSRGGGDSRKQAVLERLAGLEPWDLCSEAKVEKCRATRDLRSCGRTVQHLLTSCGHACLCLECCHRCDICPICRMPIPRSGEVLKLRLYDECVDAGLLPFFQEEEFQEKEEDGPYWTLDAWRLCSFFDIAVENSMASLVCHYVTDVCMDEAAISSDPVISMLLDGSVVKEWCKRTFLTTVRKLRDIYNSKPTQSKADALDRHGKRLQGLCYVLDALEAPLTASSASLVELQQLLESVRIVIQHLDLMTWCIRQKFLDNVPSCFTSIAHWKVAFQERKWAANDRVWPEYMANTGRLGPKPAGALFIEDALSVGLGKDDGDSSNLMLDLGSLKHGNVATYQAPDSDYPPESTRAAVDALFLEGSSDLFFAKKAIFLYYLFDRHWTCPELQWRHVIEDYVMTFSIPRQSMLESFVFYLLDNKSDEALQEACRWIPEIVSPSLHPKVSLVLLERGRPDAALPVLQSTGRFRPREEILTPLPLSEAVTVVRVLLECSMLSEAYLYQQSHVKAIRTNIKQQKDEDVVARDWIQELDVLLGELCFICIRKNCMVKVLELPWKLDEEKVLRKCLLEQAMEDPSSSSGSLLAAFYLQRCRFSEAYAVHRRLLSLERQYIMENMSTDVVQRICEQRTKLMEKSLEILPEVEREQLMNATEDGRLDNMDFDPSQAAEATSRVEEFSFRQLPTLPSSMPLTSTIPETPGFRQRPTTPAKSPVLSPLRSPFLSAANKPGGLVTPGMSPLLGKRLRYNTDASFYGQTITDFEAAPREHVPANEDRSHAMVVSW